MKTEISELTALSQGLCVLQTTSGAGLVDYSVDTTERRLAMTAAEADGNAPITVWFELDGISECTVGQPAQFVVKRENYFVPLLSGTVTSIHPYLLVIDANTGSLHTISAGEVVDLHRLVAEVDDSRTEVDITGGQARAVLVPLSQRKTTQEMAGLMTSPPRIRARWSGSNVSRCRPATIVIAESSPEVLRCECGESASGPSLFDPVFFAEPPHDFLYSSAAEDNLHEVI